MFRISGAQQRGCRARGYTVGIAAASPAQPSVTINCRFFPSQELEDIEFWGGREGPQGKRGLMWSAGVVNGEWGDAAEDWPSGLPA